MRECDVLIIGGGVAGISCACSLSELHPNLRIILAEREPILGGILNQCIHEGFGEQDMTGPQYCRLISQRLSGTDTTVLTDTEIYELQKENSYFLAKAYGEDGDITLRTPHLILASGCYERGLGSLFISGTRPDGVFTAGELQRMINLEGYKPKGSAVIVGSGDIGLIIARRLILNGCSIERILEIKDCSPALPRNKKGCLKEYNLPLKLHSRVISVYGEEVVEGVIAEDVDTGTTENIPCNMLVIAAGLIPDRSLAENLADKSGLLFAGNCQHIFPSVEGIVHSAREIAYAIF